MIGNMASFCRGRPVTALIPYLLFLISSLSARIMPKS